MTAVDATGKVSVSAAEEIPARERLINLAIDVFLFAFSLLMILPLVFLVSNAFKTPQELLARPPTLIPAEPTGGGVRAALADTPLARWVVSSLTCAVLSTLSFVSASATSRRGVGVCVPRQWGARR